MADGNGPDGEAQHLTEAQPPPVLAIGREQLTFIGDGITARLTLSEILATAAESGNPIPALLYAVVLKLADIDQSLRRALTITESQVARAEAMTTDPGKLIGEIAKHLQGLGIPMPPGTPGAES
jgi:hypothetical protein